MDREDVVKASKLAKSVNDLGFDMLRFYHRKLGAKNILISPLSLESCGAMTANIYEGKARKELLDALLCANVGLPNDALSSWTSSEMRSNKSPILVSNALFVRPSHKPNKGLGSTLAKSYSCQEMELSENNIKAKEEIERWVSKATKGKVAPNLPSFSANLRFIVANAIWFKCNWEYEFQKSKTREEDFTLSTKATVKAQMMAFEKGIKTAYGYDPGSYVVLPYADGDFVMVLVKPQDRSNLKDLLKALNAKVLQEMLQAKSDLVVSPTVPRFEMANALDLGEYLKSRGVKSAYRMQKIPSLSASQPAMMLNVLQSAWIKVDEEGTEAGAATEGFHGCAKSGPLDYNEPFIYIVCHRPTNTVVFLGICADPTAKRAL